MRGVFFVLLFVLSVKGQVDYFSRPETLHSSMRGAAESANAAYERYKRRLGPDRVNIFQKDTPLALAKPLKQVVFQNLPAYPSFDLALKAFYKLRDERFLQDSKHRIMRRSSWLFPDDGCFARAALAVQNLQKWQLTVPSKLFVFGNLTLKTAYSPTGHVDWWYHVVPAVRVGQQVLIFDPSINPKQPMRIQDWLFSMSQNIESLTLSVCHPSSYAPSAPCLAASHSSDDALDDQMLYLDYEWNRMIELKMDPVRFLGDFPPWNQITTGPTFISY